MRLFGDQSGKAFQFSSLGPIYAVCSKSIRNILVVLMYKINFSSSFSHFTPACPLSTYARVWILQTHYLMPGTLDLASCMLPSPQVLGPPRQYLVFREVVVWWLSGDLLVNC